MPGRRPGCRPCRRRPRSRTRAGSARPGSRSRHARRRSVAAEIRLCSKNQSPCRISSDTRSRSCRTSSVCQSSVTSSAMRSSASRRSSGETRRRRAARVSAIADVCEQDAAPRRLGRMRGQDELGSTCRAHARQARSAGTAASRLKASSSDSRGTVRRVRPRAAVAAGGAARRGSRAGSRGRTRAGRAPAHAGRCRRAIRESAVPRGCARTRGSPDRLDQLEQPRALLLDEHGPRIVPSRRTSRLSGAAVSRSNRRPRPRLRVEAERGQDVHLASGAIVRARPGRRRRERAPGRSRRERRAQPGWIVAAAQRLDERAERSAARAVGLDPDRLGEQLGILRDRGLATARTAPPVARAAPSARSPCDGIADGERANVGRRLDAGDAADRRRTRRRSGSSPRPAPRRTAAQGSLQSPARVSSENPCASFEKQHAARGGADDRVGQLPAELLRDLERDRLRPLARVRVEVAADESPREERSRARARAGGSRRRSR